MEEKLKELVSTYINVPGEQITADTAIDRLRVSSSIVLHRMYAKLAENGFKVDNYWNIKTFGGLVKLNNGQVVNGTATSQSLGVETVDQGVSSGIDIEEIDSMPVVDDFRESPFYTMNFAPSEISYCILQSNPYASFAGLFALKEAIVKCDNRFKNRELNTIVIEHSPLGKPVFKDFQVSVSHTGTFAAAIALNIKNDTKQAVPERIITPAVIPAPVKPATSCVAWLALLISLGTLVAILLYIKPFNY
ncbi:4'-phosphopantetheinyl transferase superfamily protein [Segetibacter sp. 3557_3]|uniref:holo-ACP synthase n=1 Tax=Segetibacter sp. 3557_3 TaxID=2547429 RepID=UPI001058D349|nr:4'-phosphopantetheinyl transferase superfamily protein [Segetibacter sp. 3557_3]TDH23317.1 4'-phosphopantetheinyl transferase superfamily protein [Segetibacter sp. 3557_3]